MANFKSKSAFVKEMNQYFVYIMASKTHVIYTGMTNDLERRVYEHKNELIEGFTKKYRCRRLVFYESSNNARLKQVPRDSSVPFKIWRELVG